MSVPNIQLDSEFTNKVLEPMTGWSEISTFRFDIDDGADRTSLHFNDRANLKLIS